MKDDDEQDDRQNDGGGGLQTGGGLESGGELNEAPNQGDPVEPSLQEMQKELRETRSELGETRDELNKFREQLRELVAGAGSAVEDSPSEQLPEEPAAPETETAALEVDVEP